MDSAELAEKISNLKFEKRDAIEKLDYNRAQEIDNMIEQEKLKAFENYYNSLTNEYSTTIKDVVQFFEEKYNNLEKRFYHKQNQTREHYNQVFEDVKKKQLQELAQLEKTYKDACNRENLRYIHNYIPGKNDLIRKSQQAATSGNYELAKQIKEEAEQYGLSYLQERLEIQQNKFENKKNSLMTHNQQVISNLNTSFTNEMNNITEKNLRSIQDIHYNRETQFLDISMKYSQKLFQTQHYATLDDAKKIIYDILQDICIHADITIPDFHFPDSQNETPKK